VRKGIGTEEAFSSVIARISHTDLDVWVLAGELVRRVYLATFPVGKPTG
jgi:hypothetical protein